MHEELAQVTLLWLLVRSSGKPNQPIFVPVIMCIVQCALLSEKICKCMLTKTKKKRDYRRKGRKEEKEKRSNNSKEYQYSRAKDLDRQDKDMQCSKDLHVDL